MKHFIKWILIIAIILLCMLAIKNIVNNKQSKVAECGVVINTEFKNIQYVGQDSYWILDMWIWHKSFHTRDYVVEWDVVCKKGMLWEKQDGFIKSLAK